MERFSNSGKTVTQTVTNCNRWIKSVWQSATPYSNHSFIYNAEDKGKRKLSSSNQWKMKKSKFRKKKEIRKRNQLNEEQASLFSVFLTGTRVDNL